MERKEFWLKVSVNLLFEDQITGFKLLFIAFNNIGSSQNVVSAVNSNYILTLDTLILSIYIDILTILKS